MVDYYKNAPRLRDRSVMPGQYQVRFARLDYSFYEACVKIERQGPRVPLFTPAKLIEEDRLLSLAEVRKWCEGVFRLRNVPAAEWVDDSCNGR